MTKALVARLPRDGAGLLHVATRWSPPGPVFGALAFIYGTLVSVGDRRRCSPCRSASASRCSSRRWRRSVAAAADRLRDRPARRRPVGRLRPVGRARARSGVRASTAASTTSFGGVPVLGTLFGPAVERPGVLDRRDHPGDHDHPDRHLAVAGGRSTPRPSARPGRRARPRRDALGDDPRRRCSRTPGAASSGAVMLGLGRAMGETIAVALVIGSTRTDHGQPCFAPGDSMPAVIANQWGEADGTSEVGADRLRRHAVRHHDRGQPGRHRDRAAFDARSQGLR